MAEIETLKQYAERVNKSYAAVKMQNSRGLLDLVTDEVTGNSKWAEVTGNKVTATREGNTKKVTGNSAKVTKEGNSDVLPDEKVTGNKVTEIETFERIVALEIENTSLRNRMAKVEVENGELRSGIIALQSAVKILQSLPPGSIVMPVPSQVQTVAVSERFIPPPDSGLKPDLEVVYEDRPPPARPEPSPPPVIAPRGERPEPAPGTLNRKEFYDACSTALWKAGKPSSFAHVEKLVVAKGIEGDSARRFTQEQVERVAQ